LAVWLLLPALLLLVLADIFLRTLLNAPLGWGHEVSGLLLISLLAFEMPRCLRLGELLNVNLLHDFLGKKTRLLLYIVTRLFIVAFAALFFWQGSVGAREMYQYDEQTFTLPLPLWPFSAMLALVGMLILLQGLVQLLVMPVADEPPVGSADL
jgi:TRAP-type C4-dicarboxylate transport system permease small subunit